MNWLDEIERTGSYFERTLGSIDNLMPAEKMHLGIAKDILRMARVIRSAESALEKIHRHARRQGTLTLSADARGEQEYIEEVAMDALGFIARGGDEQSPTTPKAKP